MDFSQPIDPRLREDDTEINKIINAGEQFPNNDPFNKNHSFNKFIDVLSLLRNEVPSISNEPTPTPSDIYPVVAPPSDIYPVVAHH